MMIRGVRNAATSAAAANSHFRKAWLSTHAPRQWRGGARWEGAFDSSVVAWCFSDSRHNEDQL
jgi:hypothetical protein